MPPRRLAAVLLTTTLLAGCNLAPQYSVPVTPAPMPTYRETGPWTPAAPADTAPRGPWWQMFGDATLSGLEDRIELDNPQLAAAVARHDQAVAQARIARADLYPSIDLNSSAERGHSLQYGDEHDFTAGGDISYEVDLWGRVRNEVIAGRANERAALADLANTRLMLQAELAEDYFNLRGLDAQITVLRQSVDAYAAALDLTTKRYAGGASSQIDVGRAQTQLSDAQAQLDQTGASRAQYEHAIAALVGADAPNFALAAVAGQTAPVPIPAQAPSILLQRRPDIAAAERRAAAANAQIGQARAALYPRLQLGGSAGYGGILGTLVKTSGFIWEAGPGSVMFPLYEGGRRVAEVKRTEAAYREQAADYKQTVLTAFQQVEDQLALSNRLASAEGQEQQAVGAAGSVTQLALIQYKEGAVDYLQVVDAQNAELQARQTAVQIRARRLIAAVDLVRALGGGWQGLPATP